MARETIKQAICTECDDEENSYTVTAKDMDPAENTITYDVRCSCGKTDEITITPDGPEVGETVSLDDASWNKEVPEQ